ncbi:unnamed protein product [Cladocopium goreaui]|uniref:TIR domain-containing protein n=1 Tax=Cladocopium goreaui TaxID=2562237 RepID=A0A9P1FI73_9DINO|nr:unnamed protein product [Cladocopium goreaui]
MNLVSQRGQAPQQAGGPPGSAGSPGSKIQPVEGLRNLYGVKEDCELLVHYGYLKESPSLSLLRDDSAAREGGYLPLWHEHVVYDSNATEFSTQVGIGPLPNEEGREGTAMD